MRRFLILSCVGLVLALGGCTSQKVLNSVTSERGYTLTSDVPYARNLGLNLDVYGPNKVTDAPVVVFFYGGRWTRGDKADYKFVGQALATRGFVVVVPNTRHYPQVRFPDFIKDGALAVKWARDNARQFGGNPAKLFVMGHSSGAHIASMIALNENYLKNVGGTRSWLKGMIGLAGPYDFLPITAPDMRDIFGAPDKYQYTQPVFFVDGAQPPLLLIHGDDDQVVPVDNTRKLAAAVKRVGGSVETEIYPRLGHETLINSFASLMRGRTDALDKTESFIKRRALAASPYSSAIVATPLDAPAPAEAAAPSLVVEDIPEAPQPVPAPEDGAAPAATPDEATMPPPQPIEAVIP